MKIRLCWVRIYAECVLRQRSCALGNPMQFYVHDITVVIMRFTQPHSVPVNRNIAGYHSSSPFRKFFAFTCSQAQSIVDRSEYCWKSDPVPSISKHLLRATEQFVWNSSSSRFPSTLWIFQCLFLPINIPHLIPFWPPLKKVSLFLDGRVKK